MSDKLVSIVVPMRQRLDTTRNLIQSLEKNTINKKDIELICLTDSDDIELNNFLDSYKYSFTVKKITQSQKTPFSLSQYYQDGLQQASNPKFMWALGNDCEINSYGWDAALGGLSLKGGTFYYIRIDDGVHVREDYARNVECGCCFPILTFNYFLTTGEFYPLETRTWGADHFLWNSLRLVNSLCNGCMEVKDLIDNIKVNHHSPHSRDDEYKRPKDESYFRMRDNNTPFPRPMSKARFINSCIAKNGLC